MVTRGPQELPGSSPPIPLSPGFTAVLVTVPRTSVSRLGYSSGIERSLDPQSPGLGGSTARTKAPEEPRLSLRCPPACHAGRGLGPPLPSLSSSAQGLTVGGGLGPPQDRRTPPRDTASFPDSSRQTVRKRTRRSQVMGHTWDNSCPPPSLEQKPAFVLSCRKEELSKWNPVPALGDSEDWSGAQGRTTVVLSPFARDCWRVGVIQVQPGQTKGELPRPLGKTGGSQGRRERPGVLGPLRASEWSGLFWPPWEVCESGPPHPEPVLLRLWWHMGHLGLS